MTEHTIVVVDGGSRRAMESITSAKFAAWDEIVRDNVFESGDETRIAQAYALLKDPTIYTYAFFRDENNKPLKLYYYQDRIINDTTKRIIFAAANQIGKSVTLCLKALHFMLNKPGTTTLMVSKTLPQSKDLLRQVRRLLTTSTLEYKDDLGEDDTKNSISIKHTVEENGHSIEVESRIICVPATEAALGYPAHLVLIDELAFFDDSEYFYEQIIQPRTYATKGQIIAFSNPNGQLGVFWKLWNDYDFSHYRFTFLDCPHNNEKEYANLCRTLPQDRIDSTLDAVFTDARGGFFTLMERQKMQEQRPSMLPAVFDKPVYFFVDWGKSQDNTWWACGVPVGDGEGRGLYVYELRHYPLGTGYNTIVDELEQVCRSITPGKVAGVGWDNTGVGRGIEDFMLRLRNIGINLFPVDFTIENKSRMYTFFKLLAERNLRNEEGVYGIKLPYDPECDKQLATLVFAKTSRGYLQVHHAQESDHDDGPDAIAGLVSIIMQLDNVPVSITIIGDDDTPATALTIDEERSEFYCDGCGEAIWDADPCPECHTPRSAKT